MSIEFALSPRPLTRYSTAIRLCAFFIFLICGKGSLPASEPTNPDRITFEFALYFSPKPSADPEKELGRLLNEPARRLQLADVPSASEALATVSPQWVPIADYAPPSAESLRYFGIGIVPADAPKFAEAERVFILRFSISRHGVLLANRSANALLADLARATDGSIWDEETRQLFSVERWKASRLESWQGGLPDMSEQVTMHAYANPTLVRIITLGMRKFGLPDLVVAEMPSQHTGAVGNFMNAFMQRLVEGQKPEKSQMRLALSEIRHATARSSALENPAKGAKGAVLVSVRSVPTQEGDPNNTLWQLDFPEAKLKETTERALWGMSELFGSTDRIIGARSGDAEMAAARLRAREALFAQESRLRKGLDAQERLLVKGPFSEGGKVEYMWVEVVKWGEKHVEGILTSDPFYVKDLHAGSSVTVALDDIYDYILHKPDGTEEGNESGKVLERLEKER